MEFRLSAAEEAFRAEVRSWLKNNLPAGWGTAAYREPYGAEEKIAASKAWRSALPRRLGGDHPAEAVRRARCLVGRAAHLNEECAAANAPDSINPLWRWVWSARR
jgi:hypothetical protein